MAYWFLKDADSGQYLQAQWNHSTNTYDIWLNRQRAWTPAFESQAQALKWLHQLLASQDAADAVNCEPVAETGVR